MRIFIFCLENENLWFLFVQFDELLISFKHLAFMIAILDGNHENIMLSKKWHRTKWSPDEFTRMSLRILLIEIEFNFRGDCYRPERGKEL